MRLFVNGQPANDTGTPMQASKGPGDGARNARQADVADCASEGLRLRSEMQRAAEEER
jgi:hypothetical protein